MRAENGKKVKVQFIGELEDGTVFGKSSLEQPLEFTLGQDQVISGFAEAVRGMEPGEKKTVQVPPENGFGNYDPDKLVSLERRRFAKDEPILPGAKVGVEDAEGHKFVGRIDSCSDDSVTVDLNHPLAGQALKFEIQLQEVF